MCLDFGHAVKAALSLRANYKKIMKDFLKLKPKVFHISDGTMGNEKDEHLNIGEGEFDCKYFLRCIKNTAPGFVTVETPRVNKNSLQDDVENINTIRKLQK